MLFTVALLLTAAPLFACEPLVPLIRLVVPAANVIQAGVWLLAVLPERLGSPGFILGFVRF
jgi:hypothetical protein